MRNRNASQGKEFPSDHGVRNGRQVGAMALAVEGSDGSRRVGQKGSLRQSRGRRWRAFSWEVVGLGDSILGKLLKRQSGNGGGGGA